MQWYSFTVWFAGPPRSGKSTLASLLRKKLSELCYPAEILDSEKVRRRLTKGLGILREDRGENLRCIVYFAKVVPRVGGGSDRCRDIAVPKLIRECDTRDQEVRIGPHAMAHQALRSAGLQSSVRESDARGALRLRGGMASYEEPVHPEIVVNIAEGGPDEGVRQLIRYLETTGYVDGSHGLPL